MRPISVMMKPASGMCNMHCQYCFYCDEISRREQASYGFMKEETLKNVISGTLIHAVGSASFIFQGGEPTLRGLDFFRRAVQYEKQYNTNGVKINNSLQTNGLLIDGTWCEFLRDNHFLVGLSVDGTKLIHDKHRQTAQGESTFDRVIGAAEMMDRFGVEYNILTVVTLDVSTHISEIYDFYKKKGWYWQQYLPCLDPLGENRGIRAYSLTPELYGTFLVELFHLWYQDFLEGQAPYIRQFDNWIGILLGYMPEACDHRGCCGIQYACEADGSVYPCDFFMLDEYKLGNFNTDGLDAIDKKRLESGFLEQSQMLCMECQKCEFYFLCRGGCKRNREAAQSDEYSNYFCSGYKKFFESEWEKLINVAYMVRKAQQANISDLACLHDKKY